MKIKTNSFLSIGIFLFICSILISCDPADNRLKVINNSDINVYIFYSCDTSLNDLTIFKNGYYHNSLGDSTYVISDLYVRSNSFLNIPMRGFNAWKKYMDDCKSNKICIYFFTDSIVNTYSCEEIKIRKLYKKSASYNLDDLKKNNWVVNYP